MLIEDRNTHWVDSLHDLPYQPDENAQFWLDGVSRMTQTLQQYFGPIQIQIIDESWKQPFGIESRLLSLTDHKVWQRLTILKTPAQPLLCARAAITAGALQTWPILGRLGQRSIGDMFLHSRQEVTRDSFYYTLLNADHAFIRLLASVLTPQKAHWARASLIKADNEPIIALTEVLLAPLMQPAKPSLTQKTESQGL